ncbi:hypothetical protein WICMUC_003248 [Wickerhamomyces mucosus]|uniref:VHS domain-containing protein n=1 Tax=Wickerhamomyces mucosus TaxID=1378264 RepID=A0A9P8PLT9_9ASCO|nr:hypothetical protein WICMUC_003248 [Wickerhamomyces mucosus]
MLSTPLDNQRHFKHRACRITLGEPDLGLNLAVADYINEKQGGSPREAAIVVVNLINSPDSHVAVFALNLLDVLVKNCGYPFHLQISRKEFLNELVKRFPERPPARYSRTQRLILTAIEEWNQTICKTSKYKEDLGFIRDMHRLLTYKGYIFPEIKQEDLSVLNPSDNLKSLSEIQKEEGLAQAAKLQELVRRGRPSDLKEANKLMKIMAGFKDDNLVESKAKVAEDLDKLKRKADIFSEMLQASERSGTLDTSDETLVELYSSLKVAQPKIQNLITEESDDEVAVQDLLKINDIVNSLVEKYNFLKNGELESASKVQVANSGSGVKESLNLIDFDDEATSGAPESSGNAVEDLLSDLGGLSFSNNNDPFGAGGEISLLGSPQATGSHKTQDSSTSPNYDIFNQLSNSGTPTPTPASTTTTVQSGSAFDLLGGAFSTSSPQPVQQFHEPAPKTSRSFINESQHLKTEIEVHRETQDTVKAIVYFSNIQSSSISNLQFLIAVPKSLTLNLEPQTGSFIASFSKDAVHQAFKITHPTNNSQLKIKWKVNYVVNGQDVEETNTYTLPHV